MTTAVPHDQVVDVAGPSDTTVLRKYLRTIRTHLVELHVEGKHVDALFVGMKGFLNQEHIPARQPYAYQLDASMRPDVISDVHTHISDHDLGHGAARRELH